MNPTRPSDRLAQKYLADLLKGLSSLHNSGFVHGNIKPSSLLLSSDNTAMLGPLGKVRLDARRHTHKLYSKVLTGQAIPRFLVYWAPELLKMDRYNHKADMWALGVSLYEIVTGVFPFNTEDEDNFREDVMTGNIDWSRLVTQGRLRLLIQNMLHVDPSQRWDASWCLMIAQEEFVIEI
jgi:serine/threonine protein kinase